MDENLAWRIRFKRFRDLEPMLDIRRDRMFLMPFENWQPTYYSLTNKDQKKVSFMPTEVWQIDPSTPVGDMSVINVAMRATDEAVKQDALERYVAGMVTYSDLLANPEAVSMPEILADPETIVRMPFKVAFVWDRESPDRSLVLRPAVIEPVPDEAPAFGR